MTLYILTQYMNEQRNPALKNWDNSDKEAATTCIKLNL